MEMEWTNDHVISLINEYKSRPVLWDVSNKMYRLQSVKYDSWCELADIFQCEVADVRQKIYSIFASYRREKSKVRLGGWSQWFLYDHLSFLPNHLHYDKSAERGTPVKLAKTKKKPEIVEEEEEIGEESVIEYDENDAETVKIVIKEEPVSVRPKIKYVNSKPRLKRVLKRRIVNKEPITERSRLVERKIPETSTVIERKIPETYYSKEKDECDTFGEYIATSLRKHDERTRSMIKQAINNILFEQEMKKYNNNCQYLVISNIEQNPLNIDDESEK